MAHVAPWLRHWMYGLLLEDGATWFKMTICVRSLSSFSSYASIPASHMIAATPDRSVNFPSTASTTNLTWIGSASIIDNIFSRPVYHSISTESASQYRILVDPRLVSIRVQLYSVTLLPALVLMLRCQERVNEHQRSPLVWWRLIVQGWVETRPCYEMSTQIGWIEDASKTCSLLFDGNWEKACKGKSNCGTDCLRCTVLCHCISSDCA